MNTGDHLIADEDDEDDEEAKQIARSIVRREKQLQDDLESMGMGDELFEALEGLRMNMMSIRRDIEQYPAIVPSLRFDIVKEYEDYFDSMVAHYKDTEHQKMKNDFFRDWKKFIGTAFLNHPEHIKATPTKQEDSAGRFRLGNYLSFRSPRILKTKEEVVEVDGTQLDRVAKRKLAGTKWAIQYKSMIEKLQKPVILGPQQLQMLEAEGPKAFAHSTANLYKIEFRAMMNDFQSAEGLTLPTNTYAEFQKILIKFESVCVLQCKEQLTSLGRRL
jgi:hypothetical protein